MIHVNNNGSNTARVTVDALAGQGMLYFEGAIVHRESLSEYFDALVENGALEICQPDAISMTKFAGELI